MRAKTGSETGQNSWRPIHKPRISRLRFRIVCVFLSLVLLGEAFAIPAFSARGGQQQIEESSKDFTAALLGLGDLKDLSRDQAVVRLESLFADIEKAKSSIPRDTFDLGAIIGKIGTDSVALFEWVRENTFMVPYQGVLRGYQGVLMDRLGNSFDRALLLYALLRDAGKEVRLAHASLSENQAEEILKKARPIPNDRALSRANSINEEAEAFLDDYVKAHQLNAKEIREKYRKLQSEQQKFSKKVGKRVREQAGDLSSMLSNPEKSRGKADFEATVEAVQDHWWVQWRDGSEWTDLDPTFPDAEAGQFLIKPKETLQPVNYSEVRDLCHSIRIRLEIEYWEKGKLEKAEVLNQVMLPAVMFGKKIVLRHVPPAWPQDLTLYQGGNREESLKKTVLDQREWLPVLSVDADSIYKYSFLADSKNIFDATLPGWAAAALKGREVVDATKAGGEAAGNRVRNMLSRRSRVQQPQESKVPTGIHLTAEWVEYEIAVPGREPQKIRREIFDLLGPAMRASGGENVPLPEMTEAMRMERGFALLEQIEILPLVCRLSPEFVADLTAGKMLANREILLDILRSGELSISQELADKLSRLTPLPGPGYSLALARDEWSRLSDDVYLDRPNILSYFKGVRQCPECKPLEYQGYDIVANEVAVHLNSSVDPFQARLEQGVADTNAEAFLLGAPGKIVNNTAELYDISKKQHKDWLTVRDASDPSWENVSLSEDLKERINREVSDGYIAVVPKKAISFEDRDFFGWWRINPNTGDTLGIGDKGRGQGTLEYFLKLSFNIGAFYMCMFSIDSQASYLELKYVICIVGVAIAAGALYAGLMKGVVGALIEGVILGVYSIPEIMEGQK